jgi:small-conductance mechanosensitive channel
MQNFILVCLALIAVGMIFIGAIHQILPPILTGVGFLLIIILFKKQR